MDQVITHTERDTAAVDIRVGEPFRGLAPSINIHGAVFVFRVVSDPEPDVFARIANVFNFASAAPYQVTLHLDPQDLVSVAVAIELSGASVADMIRRKLDRLTSTIYVDVTMCRSAEQLEAT